VTRIATAIDEDLRAMMHTGLSRPRTAMAKLESFTACCWETASLDRTTIRTVWERTAAHGEATIMLTSCQRIEIYRIERCACEAPLKHSGIDALQHLAEVAAGLHSVVLGEAQILGQVRTAIQQAPVEVRPLAEIALAAARELRRETAFHSHSGHLLDRAIHRAGVEAEGHLLVIGAGAVGRLVAQRGRELGFDRVSIASRRQPETAWFQQGHFRFVTLGAMRELDTADVVVGCLGSEAAELRPGEDLPTVQRLIVDLGTPRNFADDATVPIVTIASMLGPGNDRPHSDARRAALKERLAEILQKRLAMARQDSGSPVGNLRQAVETVRQKELDRLRQRHPEIPSDTLDAITRSMINRIFHAPSTRLKKLNNDELAHRVAELFAEEDESERFA
jgi:glutamyl-tRNA reductase